jgi:Api92-like protein with ferredoxin domain
MPNWCSNTVSFTGERSQLDELETLFTQMAETEKAENRGQLPPFIETDGDWYFEISWEFDTLYYETRWSPNIEVMKKVAEHYGVGFTQCYIETGNLVYGEATFENGDLQDIYLEPSDFDQYEYYEDTDTYTFDNEVYESNDEILEILLERKKTAKLSTFKN